MRKYVKNHCLLEIEIQIQIHREKKKGYLMPGDEKEISLNNIMWAVTGGASVTRERRLT